MKDPGKHICRIALVQAEPVMFNKQESLKVGKRTEPGRTDWKRYYDASVVAGGDEFIQLAGEAKKSGVYISIGFSERARCGWRNFV